MIRLHPLHLKDAYWKDIERQLAVIFTEELFTPIFEIIARANPAYRTAENATTSALRRALLSGRIQYDRGVFSGKLSAAITLDLRSLGATFDKRSGTYRLADDKVPFVVREAANTYRVRARLAHDAITQELQRAAARVAGTYYSLDAQKMIAQVDDGWRASAAKLAVQPVLPKESAFRLSEAYNYALDLPIKGWLQDQVQELRKDVEGNARAGYRFDSLVDKIEKRKGMSERKATFLARQETSLFMSKFQAERFQAAGVTKYQWSTSHDIRVRPYDDGKNMTPASLRHAGDHRELDGLVFSWSAPPAAKFFSIGKPSNPGEDYNCRCVAIPLA